MDYTTEQCLRALERATERINSLHRSHQTYVRGTNDCVAFMAAYDEALRGSTKTWDYIDFEWSSVREFVVKLGRQGFTSAAYVQYCGYDLVPNKRPILGDITFEGGAMLFDGTFWLSTDEKNNKGVQVKRQGFLFERRLDFIARPKKLERV